jgi:hypothetical protein
MDDDALDVDDYRLPSGRYIIGARIVEDRETARAELAKMVSELGPMTLPMVRVLARSPRLAGAYERSSRATNRRAAASEWRYVIARVEAGRGHPSNDHLRRLFELAPVPEFARKYFASRIGRGPGARPFPEPDAAGLFGEFRAVEIMALADLQRVHGRLKAYRTTDVRVGRPGRRFRWLCWPKPNPTEPAPAPGAPLVRVERPRYWRIEQPKEQAYRMVGRRYAMAVETLRDLEAKFRSGLPRNLPGVDSPK